MLTVTIILLYVLSFVLIWQFVGYPLLMIVTIIMSKPKEKDYSYQPFISILVPTYNEEKVIKKRIENLTSLEYPKDKYETIIIDSGSTDSTVKIIEDIIMSHVHNVKLIREKERNGKAPAISLGNKYAKGPIIITTDANSIFDENVLKEISSKFKDPKVGAVSGRYAISNMDNNLPSSEAFYWEIENIIFKGESYLDSISTVIGTISAWRKDIMNFRAITISEDLDMTLQTRRSGYKIIYEPAAMVYEPAAISSKDQIKQRRRTSVGTIQNIFEHIKYLLPPRNLYTILIFPSHKILPMLSPFILISIVILYMINKNINIILTHFILTTLIFGVLFVILIRLKSWLIKENKNRLNKNKLRLSITKIIYYVLLNEYIILLAWKDFIFKRYSVLWEKVESTREG